MDLIGPGQTSNQNPVLWTHSVMDAIFVLDLAKLDELD